MYSAGGPQRSKVRGTSAMCARIVKCEIIMLRWPQLNTRVVDGY